MPIQRNNFRFQNSREHQKVEDPSTPSGLTVRGIGAAVKSRRAPQEKASPYFDMGEVVLTEFERPLRTTFGEFKTGYEYKEGCISTSEFSRGIEAFRIELSASDDGNVDLVYMIGKSHDRASRAGFRQEAYRPNSDHPFFATEISQRQLPYEISVGQYPIQSDEDRLYQLENILNQPESQIDMDALTVVRIDGFMNGQRS